MAVIDLSPPLAVGERVGRIKDLFDDRATTVPRFGTITEVYEDQPNGLGRRYRQYAVRWDDTGQVERGYLGVGLTRMLLVTRLLGV